MATGSQNRSQPRAQAQEPTAPVTGIGQAWQEGAVRAKIRIDECKPGPSGYHVHALAVTAEPDGTPSVENQRFFEATPTLNLDMVVTEQVGQLLQPGQEYYLDFIPAELIAQSRGDQALWASNPSS